jgi:hypothetical protein
MLGWDEEVHVNIYVTSAKLRNKDGEVRYEQWLGSAPDLNEKDRILSLGKVSWESGKSTGLANVAHIDTPHRLAHIEGLTLRGPIRHTVWSDNTELQIGDEVLLVISGSHWIDQDNPVPTAEELLTEFEAIQDVAEHYDRSRLVQISPHVLVDKDLLEKLR